MPATVTVDVEVRYAETDAMGIVHHANYVVWFELARTRLCQGSGYSYAEIEARGHFLTVVGMDVRYRRAVRYGQSVRVSARVDRLESRRMTFGYDVRDEAGALVATGRTEHLWVDRESGRTCRMPEYLEEAFGRMATAPETA